MNLEGESLIQEYFLKEGCLNSLKEICSKLDVIKGKKSNYLVYKITEFQKIFNKVSADVSDFLGFDYIRPKKLIEDENEFYFDKDLTIGHLSICNESYCRCSFIHEYSHLLLEANYGAIYGRKDYNIFVEGHATWLEFSMAQRYNSKEMLYYAVNALKIDMKRGINLLSQRSDITKINEDLGYYSLGICIFGLLLNLRGDEVFKKPFLDNCF